MINIQTGDINILLSMLNMKLRDEFPNLNELIYNFGIDKNELLTRMEDNGYYYNERENQFKRK